jgi:hypothetical protein
LKLETGRSWRTRAAGVFLFLPLLARLGFQRIVSKADYAGSRMIPPISALLSLLALKLLDKERRSQILDQQARVSPRLRSRIRKLLTARCLVLTSRSSCGGSRRSAAGS